MKPFIVAAPRDYSSKKIDIEIPSQDELTPPWELRDGRGGPSRRCELVVRYRQSSKNKNLFECEAWDMYCPVNRGRFGRQRSVLRTTYQMMRKAGKDYQGNRQYRYRMVGLATSYYWTGIRHKLLTYSIVEQERNRRGDIIKRVEFDVKGRLTNFVDSTRGDMNERVVEYSYDSEGGRTLRRKRGRYSDWRMTNSWSKEKEIVTRVNESGLPLMDDGDYLQTTLDTGKVIGTVRFVAGQKHGIEKTFNKFGRVIDEEFYHHGTEVPGWVYRKPEDISVEEILDERNIEVKRAMLELQGFEVFLARADRAGMCSVIDTHEDDRVGQLIRIELPGLTDEQRRSQQDVVDAHVYTLLKVKDGTLDKSYILRVPNNMRSAREANAWTWGLKEEEYAPAIER